MSSRSIEEIVREKYAAVATGPLSSAHEGARKVAQAFGYSPEELASIPDEANMGLSCGNPTATASLKPGEVVVDLGCGGGLDVFLAAAKVGPTGKAIGIDMTPAMLDRARDNAERRGIRNVEFHEARIDALPIPTASADCIISNCVINLAPDKPAVFREMVRVLRPGGRLSISDIALKKPLPPEIADDLMAFVGCVAGALPIEDYVSMLREAGFSDVAVIDTHKDLNAYGEVEGQSCCCPPAMDAPAGDGLTIIAPPASSCAPASGEIHEKLADLLSRYDINEYAASVQIHAIKP